MAIAVTLAQLRSDLTGGAPIQLLDVRRSAVFESAQALIAGARWRDPDALQAWAAALDANRPVVVYCVHGHQVSQGCADKLGALGLQVSYLEGGFEAWKAAGGPLASKQECHHEVGHTRTSED